MHTSTPPHVHAYTHAFVYARSGAAGKALNRRRAASAKHAGAPPPQADGTPSTQPRNHPRR
eukprot:3141837-Lingulodinium_polyedra.AAC.1